MDWSYRICGKFVRQMGIPVETKSIEDVNYPPESFDAIVMREVIEHLPHPLDSLRTVHSWLKPEEFSLWQRVIMTA